MPEDTATVEAPPQETPAPAPAPEAAPAPSEEAAPAFTSEAAPEPSETPSAEPVVEPTVEPPAWAQFTDTAEVLAHESFAEPLAERDTATYNRVKDQMQPHLQRTSQSVANIDASMKAQRAQIEDMVEDGVLDEKAVRRLKADAPQLFQDYNEYIKTTGNHAGQVGAVDALIKASGANMPDATARLSAVLDEGNVDPTLVEDVVAAIGAAAVTKYAAKKEGEARKVVEANVRAELQDAARKTQNPEPVAEPTGGAGGGGAGTTYKTKMEARTLHVQDKITNAEMKRINADPTIPEM